MRIFVFVILFVVSTLSKAQFKIIDAGLTHIEFEFEHGEYAIKNVEFGGERYTQINARGFFPNYEIGAPDLPTFNRFIEVPEQINYTIEIKELKFSDTILIYDVLPVPEPMKKTSSERKYYKDKKFYNPAVTYPSELIKIIDNGYVGEQHLATLSIRPFEYEFKSKRLRIYKKIRAVVHFDSSIKKTFTNQNQLNKIVDLVSVNSQFLSKAKAMVSEAPVGYLIISDTIFKSLLTEFVEWKQKKGFVVTVKYVQEIGKSVGAIKNFVKNFYDTSSIKPTYLLIVGDHGLVPSTYGNTGSHISDWNYVQLTNDNLPEMIVGRFSANNIDELKPQIEKTLKYEKYLFDDDSFLNRVLLISGMDNTYSELYGNGQLNYLNNTYFNSENGYINTSFYYPEAGTKSEEIKKLLSDGQGFVNYSAHGQSYYWVNPRLTKDDVKALKNTNKYSFIVANACLTGKFNDYECIAECFLRQPDVGAIGYIGATNDTYWDEDYWWAVGVGDITLNQTYSNTGLGAFDRMLHTHGEDEKDWYVTQGQMIYAGNLAVELSQSTLKQYYWEVYHLFGDPSLMPYWKKAEEIQALHSDFVPIGATQLYVITQPYSYIALSQDGKLLGTAFADKFGHATVYFGEVKSENPIDIVITNQNRKPYIKIIKVKKPEGALVIPLKVSINDEKGNNNGKIDYGETISFDLTLKNFGLLISKQLKLKISTNNKNISIINSFHLIENVEPQVEFQITSVFEIKVSENVLNLDTFSINLQIIDEFDNILTQKYVFVIYAPAFKVQKLYAIYDGGEQKYIMPNTSFILKTFIINTGLADAKNINVKFKNNYLPLKIDTTDFNISFLKSGDTLPIFLHASLSDKAKIFDLISLEVISSCNKNLFVDTIYTIVGLLKEDFETCNFGRFKWYLYSKESEKPWEIAGKGAYGGTCCAVSAEIGHEQKSDLKIKCFVFEDDSISFYYRVSCEEKNYDTYWDYLEFLINGKSIQKWAGNTGWAKASFSVNRGLNEFLWRYSKDYSGSQYEDRAWIDEIVFPAKSIFYDITSISKNNNNAGRLLKIYPDPSQNLISLESSSLNLEEYSILIYDLLGKEVINKKLANGMNIIDLSNLKQGVYFIKITNKENIFIEKIFIE